MINKKSLIHIILVLLCLISFDNWLIAQAGSMDNRIPLDLLDTDGDGSVTITEPGHYYLRDTMVVTEDNAIGITIDSDNVTIDLNGFALIAGPQRTDEGIYISPSHNNITIKNGVIAGFGGNGIYGVNAAQSTFRNIIVKDNGWKGIWTDFNCLLVNCTSMNNGNDGIFVDDGSIVRDCTSAFNGDDGIATSEGCIVYNCTAYGNTGDGIAASQGSRVESCVVYDNAVHGFDLSRSVLCMNNTAYRNGWNGIDLYNSALVVNNISNDNGVCITEGTCGTGTNGQGSNLNQGVGIRTPGNTVVMNNHCKGNYFGIAVSGGDCMIQNNSVQNNSHAGIIQIVASSFFAKNVAEGNGYQQSPWVTDTSIYPLGNIVFGDGDFENNSVGPIIDVSTSGDISTVSGADHPFANFNY